ncbi:low affinity immunoglobulin gamma Fc region receptor II-like [Ammospiza caudacuta]|uniref:low affinity immunoglobulin gamma Fc region receptor II-like n=1 Tax=Ammospiza caudacuta TaxID=2857398 RepID=UPI002739D519|nr:low affinity immunoglobulin gamma Fc region receptor II-like [Ammospiza caudacuta]
MAGDTGLAEKVALLLWAQTLSLAGCCPLSPTSAQTTHLPVEPPWRPAVLWDRVTLTCKGSGTTGGTIWYRNVQRWGQERQDHFTVTYLCDRPGSGCSSPVTVSNDHLVLKVPAQALLDRDTVTLRCREQWNNTVTEVRFYQNEKDLRGPVNVTELSLSSLQLNHTSSYEGLVLEGPPEPTVGSPLTLSCLSTPSPLRPQAPSCTCSTGTVPVADVTITSGPL